MFNFCLDAIERKMKSVKLLPRQNYLEDFFNENYIKISEKFIIIILILTIIYK
jgi:hypothetical protein